MDYRHKPTITWVSVASRWRVRIESRLTLVKDYVASTKGMLTLHFLPGYAPELNPDEMVWSRMKRAGVARTPLRRGEKLQAKIEAQLSAITRMPQLIRSFCNAPSVAYITDW
jgi:transposase